MKKGKLLLDKSFTQNVIDDRLYSSFIEHLGRAVYSGIYEPGHSTADSDGFRKDVLDLVRELNVAMVRYPGGNFLSGYKWTDGIGPAETRPRRLDLAWRTTEPNTVGIDEFVKWAAKANVQVMGAVNMGTGTPDNAGAMLEYCNHPGGTEWSDLRRKNGSEKPHSIKTWCVGNEMDGPWQICQLSAQEYGSKAREAIKIMKWTDPSIETVVCGSSSPHMPTYPEWDRVVLEHTYEQADFLSIHRYYENMGNDLDFLASFHDMDNFIHTVTSTADYVKAVKRSKKTLPLSFDEWNVWYQSKIKLEDWTEAPSILEDNYSLLDALVFGGLGITLINNSDRVKIACLAQLVNVIAPIWTERGGAAIRQTIYHPFRLLSKYGRGTVIRPAVNCGKTETVHGDTPLVNICAVHDETRDELNVFALNIAGEEMKLTTDTRSFEGLALTEHICIDGADRSLTNTFASPDAVTPRSIAVNAADDGVLLPPASWNLFRYKKNQE
jgi:alpha-N-arabinofuranosidase